MTGFTANQPAPPPGAESIIHNTRFWPDIEPTECREKMRLDGTITAPRLRDALVDAMTDVNYELSEWAAAQVNTLTADPNNIQAPTLADVPADQIDGESIRVSSYRRAVYYTAAATLTERERQFDATGHAASKHSQERTDAMADDYRRQAQWAISAIRGVPRVTSALI